MKFLVGNGTVDLRSEIVDRGLSIGNIVDKTGGLFVTTYRPSDDKNSSSLARPASAADGCF